MAAKYERVEGRVRDLVQSGEAVVETASGLVFARFGAPGEKVVVSLDPKGGRVRRGRVLTVLEPAPERVEPACPYATRCGGCALMHVSIETQRSLKQRFLRDALVRAGAPESLEVRFTGTEQVFGYRRRARLAYRVAGNQRQLGYRRERSHELIDVTHCVVLEAPLEEALAALREVLLPELSGEGEIALARGERGGPVAVLRSQTAQSAATYAACEALVRAGRLEGLALWLGGASKPALFGAATEWADAYEGTALEGTLGGFSQAHAQVNRLLVTRVRELAKTAGTRVLELYAGHGNITVALAGEAQSYVAVEQDAAAVAALRKNLAARGLSIKVVEGDAAKQLAGGPLDVVVLDPPRAGAPQVLTSLASRKAKRVVYVSCDPATLARDVGPLIAQGFQITWAEAFDMFPQTADLESLVVLERN